jgi:hypothetical protein
VVWVIGSPVLHVAAGFNGDAFCTGATQPLNSKVMATAAANIGGFFISLSYSLNNHQQILTKNF